MNRRNATWWTCLVLLLALFACGQSSTVSPPAPTATVTRARVLPPATPTRTLPAKPALVLSGSGSKQTAPFLVGPHWRIAWTCDPKSFQNIAYNVIISVYHASDASLVGIATNATCKPGDISGTSDQYGAGTYYLSVVSEGDWHITVTTV